MKFNINTNTFKEALESIQVKGKYVKKGGLSSGSLDDIFYMKGEGNELQLWSGNNTFVVNIVLDVEFEEEGGFICRSSSILPYLKKFGEDVTVETGDFMTLSSGTRKASIPRVVEWSNIQVITRLGPRLSGMPVVLDPENIPTMGKAKFEGAFIISNETFSDVISGCELVKSGVYKIDASKESLTFSSDDGINNNYTEEVTPMLRVGDEATVEFSGPLHKFFKKDQILTFYVLDDAPIVIIADDRRLVKAPYVGGV